MKQATIFDINLGRKLRDKAIEQSELAAKEHWKQRALEAVRIVASQQHELTTDDLWKLVAKPREPRAMGAIMRKAQKLNWIWPSDRMIPTQRAEAHSSPKRVWISKICRHDSR